MCVSIARARPGLPRPPGPGAGRRGSRRGPASAAAARPSLRPPRSRGAAAAAARASRLAEGCPRSLAPLWAASGSGLTSPSPSPPPPRRAARSPPGLLLPRRRRAFYSRHARQAAPPPLPPRCSPAAAPLRIAPRPAGGLALPPSAAASSCSFVSQPRRLCQGSPASAGRQGREGARPSCCRRRRAPNPPPRSLLALLGRLRLARSLAAGPRRRAQAGRGKGEGGGARAGPALLHHLPAPPAQWYDPEHSEPSPWQQQRSPLPARSFCPLRSAARAGRLTLSPTDSSAQDWLALHPHPHPHQRTRGQPGRGWFRPLSGWNGCPVFPCPWRGMGWWFWGHCS